MTDVDIEAKKAAKKITGIIKDASLKQALYGWAVVAAVVALAVCDQWRWAWLVLGMAAFRTMLDGPLGITAAITGLMFQTAQIDERLKAALRR